MKATNIILSILILLMAIACAVFSYFLFEKRTMFVAGWSKMAKEINATAAALDKGSVAADKALAKKLTPASLSHEKYTDLDSLLKDLHTRGGDIIVQRDTLAGALQSIGIKVEAASAPDKAMLCNLDSYAAGKDAVINGVINAIDNRDKIFNRVAQIGRGVQAPLDTRKMKSGDYSSVAPLDRAITNLKSIRQKYQGTLQSIGRKVEARVSGSAWSDTGYSAAADSVYRGVADLDNRCKEAQRNLQSANEKNRAQERRIASMNQEIARQKKVISDKDDQILGLRRALGIADADPMPVLWKDGSVEARKALIGRVIEVNTDYGYIAINIGRDTTVSQAVGNKQLVVKPLIEKGLDMVVYRGELGDSSEFIARVTIDEVGAKCSTANIPTGAEKIKVGDYVCYQAK